MQVCILIDHIYLYWYVCSGATGAVMAQLCRLLRKMAQNPWQFLSATTWGPIKPWRPAVSNPTQWRHPLTQRNTRHLRWVLCMWGKWIEFRNKIRIRRLAWCGRWVQRGGVWACWARMQSTEVAECWVSFSCVVMKLDFWFAVYLLLDRWQLQPGLQHPKSLLSSLKSTSPAACLCQHRPGPNWLSKDVFWVVCLPRWDLMSGIHVCELGAFFAAVVTVVGCWIHIKFASLMWTYAFDWSLGFGFIWAPLRHNLLSPSL